MTTDNELPVDVELDPNSTAIETQIERLTNEGHQKALEELGIRVPDRERY